MAMIPSAVSRARKKVLKRGMKDKKIRVLKSKKAKDVNRMVGVSRKMLKPAKNRKQK